MMTTTRSPRHRILWPGGRKTKLPLLPIELDGHRPTRGGSLPQPGEHTREVLLALGYGDAEIEQMIASGSVG